MTKYHTRARFDGVAHDVTIYVRNHTDGNRYYDHAVVQKESPAGLPESGLAENQLDAPTPPFAGLDISLSEIDGRFNQGPRGTFSPERLTISLLKAADLSTFLHESGTFARRRARSACPAGGYARSERGMG